MVGGGDLIGQAPRSSTKILKSGNVSPPGPDRILLPGR
jgi:hypothetical protein